MMKRLKILEQTKIKSDLKKLHRIIRRAKGIIITGHVNPDGDDISSQLALGEYLKNIDKRHSIVWNEEVPKAFHFLPDFGKIINVHNHEIEPSDYDTIIVVDSGDLERIGDVRNLIQSYHRIINIDHHQINTCFGHLNIVMENACSIGEILYYYFILNRIKINKKIADYLYISIVTDTGSFNYDCMHPEVHLIAADLMEKGVVPADFNISLYQNKSLSYIKLLSMVLSRLELISNGKIALSYLFYEDFRNDDEDDTDGIIEYLGMLEGVSVYVLIKEKSPGVFNASLRSKFHVDVAKIAKDFGGGGHMRAAGCKTDRLTYEEFKKQVISKIQEQL